MAAYMNGQLVRLAVTHTCTATPVSQPYTTTAVTACAFGHTHTRPHPPPAQMYDRAQVHSCAWHLPSNGTRRTTWQVLQWSGSAAPSRPPLGALGCSVLSCVIVISVKCWVWCVVCGVTADPERGRRINRIAQYRRVGHQCWGGTSNRVLSSACAIPFPGLVDFRC